MRSVRHPCAAYAAIAIMILAAPAQSAGAQTLPSAKSLMEKHDAAVGGRAAMDKHTSIHETVSLSIAAANMNGVVDVYQSKPNLYFSKTSFAQGEFLTGYDGTTAWGVAPQGAQVLDAVAAEPIKRQADFFADYYNPGAIKSAETVEITDFEGQRCYKVKIVHTDDTEATIYFDSATGLRAGQSAIMQGVPSTQLMSDYKTFGGVMMPTKRVTKIQGAEVVMQVTAVEFDKVEPTVYALPPAVKALVKP
jgi:hypothetical protein